MPRCGCSDGSTSSTACSARRRPSSSSTCAPERCLRWSGTMARAEFHESYIELASVLAERAAELGLTPSGREVVVLRDPTDKGLAGGDETVLRYELCLPVSGGTTATGRGGPRRTGGRPVRAQRLHRPLRGRLPLRLRQAARMARRQRPRAARPAAHALRPRRAGHGRPGRLRHRAHLAGHRAAAPPAPKSGSRTCSTTGCVRRARLRRRPDLTARGRARRRARLPPSRTRLGRGCPTDGR